MHSLSENTLNELKKSGVKTDFLNTLALYLDSYPDFHGAFLKQLDDVEGNCFEFLQRYWKIPAHNLIEAFFHDLKIKRLEMEALGEEVQSRLLWILCSDLDKLLLRFHQQSQEEDFEKLVRCFREIYSPASRILRLWRMSCS